MMSEMRNRAAIADEGGSARGCVPGFCSNQAAELTASAVKATDRPRAQ